ncbi:hypothetical protein GS462_21720 [Rhodococcus hoagii]|nr:hypothetical protein [Prescottella equi]MBM4653016.1 hypothetical protein [Prescottella equi]MBM4687714.1 hypothetical protein [Prescottella equi]
MSKFDIAKDIRVGKKLNRRKKSGTGRGSEYDRVPERPAIEPPPRREPNFENALADFKWGNIRVLSKIRGAQTNPFTGQTTLDMIGYHDSIHPHPLRFDPPLIEHARGNSRAFTLHWEKLTYVFELPDPASFPHLSVSEGDREILERFVKICKELAGYSCINDGARFHIDKDDQEEWHVRVDFPSQEAFRGTCVAFRQLHNGKEFASFDKVKGRLQKAISQLPQGPQQDARAALSPWVDARGKLMNSLLATLVCRKGAPGDAPPPPEVTLSFENIEPDKLLQTFNYGDTIHFSERREDLVDLLSDDRDAAYYKYAVLQTILGLSHLYFGVAVLIETALSGHHQAS